jgi:hypothetical protein
MLKVRVVTAVQEIERLTGMIGPVDAHSLTMPDKFWRYRARAPLVAQIEALAANVVR